MHAFIYKTLEMRIKTQQVKFKALGPTKYHPAENKYPKTWKNKNVSLSSQKSLYKDKGERKAFHKGNLDVSLRNL